MSSPAPEPSENHEFQELIVPGEHAGLRLDRFLAQALPDISRARFQALITSGQILVSGRTIVEARHRVKPDDAIIVTLPPPVDATPRGEAMALDILYEDTHLAVINKPPGLVVHPGPGNWTGTLVNGLIAHCAGSLSGIGGVRRPGIVHRLDKLTSGVMVIAKTDQAHQHLSAQFASHGRDGRLKRLYKALVWGRPLRPFGTIDAPIGRKPGNRTKMAIARTGGRHAVTRYRLLEAYHTPDGAPLASLVECELETGRTHQIRVHMAHTGHPVLGDDTYATGFRTSASKLTQDSRNALGQLARQALHAASLGFVHPVTGAPVAFSASIPEDMQALVLSLQKTNTAT